MCQQIHVKLIRKRIISPNTREKNVQSTFYFIRFLIFFPYWEEGYIKYVKVVLEETTSQIYPPTVTWIIAYVWANTFTGHHLDGNALTVALGVSMVSSLGESQDHTELCSKKTISILLQMYRDLLPQDRKCKNVWLRWNTGTTPKKNAPICNRNT